MSRCDCDDNWPNPPLVDDGTPDSLSRFGTWTLHLPTVSLTASRPFYWVDYQALGVRYRRERYDIGTRQAWCVVDADKE